MSEKSQLPLARKRPILTWPLGLLALGAFFFYNGIGYVRDEEPAVDPFQVVADVLETNLAGEWLKKYTSEAHLPGTNFGLVQWTRDKFEEYGLKASIDTYDIFVSYPDLHDLNLIEDGKVTYKAPLEEDVIDEDKTSSGDDRVPTFLAYGANGNVTAEYVYVNYGRVEDFEELAKLGVDVKGKIAVIRYGAIFRGLKVKFAQDNGAVGVLLYTDPGDDGGVTPKNGYKQYPDGPARHESSVQRGSVQFLGAIGAAPGDPTTPGYASKGDVERQDPHSAIGKIPVLPISYREVKPILAKLNKQGTKSPKHWHGELDGFDYHVGPNPNATLNLYSNQIFNITPLWNVYGEIEGERKDEVIVIGNHRDAWIKGGAGDPNSGSAALLEIARALGELKKAGYKFKRSIILQSYDGEEYGLLGLTEFGEWAAKSLQKNVVAYLNMDVAVVGRYLGLHASPLLKKPLLKAAKLIEYPEPGVGSLYDHFVTETNGNIGNLGSGSDYTVFLEHLGIASADLGFGQGKGDAIYQYHSNYDSYHWMSKFGDKGFVYHNLAAKYLAYVALDLTTTEVTDFSVEDYADDLVKYFDQVKEIVPKKWLDKKVAKEALQGYLSDATNEEYVAAALSKYYASKFFFPELLKFSTCKHSRMMTMMSPKNVTFGTVLEHARSQLVSLQNSTLEFDLRSLNLQEQYDHREDLHWWQRVALHFKIVRHNKLLQYFERNFLFYHGLHEREWFKHIVFASGRFTGYAGQTWPGIREAIEDDDFDRAVKWLGIAARAAKRASVSLA